MSLIDQRILIVAPAEAVWSYLTSPALMPKWNKACKQVSILSTRPTGVGARRRCVDGLGRTSVEETTAWLENLGYEYVMIDGPYRQYRARLRLQAVAEGTMVNWTVEYRLRGLVPGVRNLFGWRRGVNRLMLDSLKQLKRLVESSGIQLDRDKQARFAMQAAPDAAARAARGSEIINTINAERTVPVRMAAKPIIPDDDPDEIIPPLPVTPMPTPAPANIRPAMPTIINMPKSPVVASMPSVSKATPERSSIEKEPSFVNNIPSTIDGNIVQETPSSAADTKPRRPQGLTEAIAAQNKQTETAEVNPSLEDSAELRAQNAMTVPISMVAPPSEPDLVTQTLEIRLPKPLPERLPTPPAIPVDKDKTEPKPPRPLIKPDTKPEIKPERTPDTKPDLKSGRKETPIPLNMVDTGQISIWDVFGVERPSDRAKADLVAVIASLQGPTKPSFTASTQKQSRQKVVVALRTPPQRNTRHKVNAPVQAFKGGESGRDSWRK